LDTVLHDVQTERREKAVLHDVSQAREADRREKAERQAFEAEFGWMSEADLSILGLGPHPVTPDRFFDEAEHNGELLFKAIEQRKVPDDQGYPLEDSLVGSAIVIWNQAQITAIRHANWASVPMAVSGKILDMMFDRLPKGSHVDLVIETAEVREAVTTWDKQVYWRRGGD
jgi:hypothetical protein